MSELTLRPEVRAFAEAMERELRANDHKGGWKGCTAGWLFSEMTNHKRQLRRYWNVRFKGIDPEMARRILDDAADVANFAMMIADVLGALPVQKGGEG